MNRVLFFFLLLALALTIAGCDRMITPRNVQTVKDADAKAAEGAYLQAISLYESALDNGPGCAEIHYKLALLYDDKMSDPLNALHHFKRYLTLDPTGSHATEVKKLMKRDEVTLATTLSGDAIVTRAEAARLKNENLTLRKELEERALRFKSTSDSRGSHLNQTAKAGDQTYVVQEGDTLYSIARKFYNSGRRWKDIRDANKKTLAGSAKLQPGETLTIP